LLPLVIAQLLGYFNDETNFITAIMWGLLLAVGIFVSGLIHHPTFNNAIIYGMRLRVSCAGLVYREVSHIF